MSAKSSKPPQIPADVIAQLEQQAAERAAAFADQRAELSAFVERVDSPDD